MSPMKGGVRARKFSLPMAHMSRPRMRKCCSTTPSSENSLMAQLSQRETSLSDHNRGSVPAAQTKQKFQFRKNKTLWLSYFEEHAHNNKRDTHTVAAEIAKVLSCSLRSSSTTESNEQLPLGFLLDDASAVCPPPPLLLLHPPPHINKQVCVGEKGGGGLCRSPHQQQHRIDSRRHHRGSYTLLPSLSIYLSMRAAAVFEYTFGCIWHL